MAGLLFLLVVLSFKLGLDYSESKGYNCKQCERFEMCQFKNTTQDEFVAGLSYGTKYYCVWTKGKTSDEISNITNHEICHQLVAREQDHFCFS